MHTKSVDLVRDDVWGWGGEERLREGWGRPQIVVGVMAKEEISMPSSVFDSIFRRRRGSF